MWSGHKYGVLGKGTPTLLFQHLSIAKRTSRWSVSEGAASSVATSAVSGGAAHSDTLLEVVARTQGPFMN